MLTSLIFTMWIAFGQTLARHAGTYKVDPLPTTTEGCPADWLHNITTVVDEMKNATTEASRYDVLFK